LDDHKELTRVIHIVLLTAVDVLIVLAFFQRPEKGRKGMMAFELLIVCLVSHSSESLAHTESIQLNLGTSSGPLRLYLFRHPFDPDQACLGGCVQGVLAVFCEFDVVQLAENMYLNSELFCRRSCNLMRFTWPSGSLEVSGNSFFEFKFQAF
jgi:hypothetical protein